ncbi:MAG: hypothetical protein AMXMBFR49_31020 [Chlorobiota bacterium]
MTKISEQREQIAQFAFIRFRETGFSRIPVDEIAKGMKISKKTIYKHFTSKEELVEAAFRSFMRESAAFVAEVAGTDDVSVLKLVKILNRMLTQTTLISNDFINDLQQTMPALWEEFDNFRSSMMRDTISKIYAQGIEEGLVKKFPLPIVVAVFVGGIREVIKSEFLAVNGFSFNQAVAGFYRFMLTSIMTDKGNEEFSNLIYGVLQNEKI